MIVAPAHDSERSVGQAAVNERRLFKALAKPDYAKRIERWIAHGITGANISKVEPADNHAEGKFALDVEFAALAYAQSMLQQQQQQQKQDGDKNQDKKDQKDQQKENKKQEQQKQEEQKQEQSKEEQAKKESQPRKDKISKEDAEKILQALNNDEKKTQKKLNVKEGSKIKIEKEW